MCRKCSSISRALPSELPALVICGTNLRHRTKLTISRAMVSRERYGYVDTEGILSWDESSEDESQGSTSSDNVTSESEADEKEEDLYSYYSAKYLDFTDCNPTTYHVVNYFKELLQEHGFVFIDEQEPVTEALKQELNNGGFFFTIRSGLTIIPFIIGGSWTPQQGSGIAGCHIDAITHKLKPSSKRDKVDGYQLLGIVPYSRATLNVWLDRDLGIGGNLLVKKDGKFVRKLVKSPIPIAKIPSLAEHFGESPQYNRETEFVPIVGYSTTDEEEIDHPLASNHSPGLLKYLSSISDTPLDDIVELELELFDVQKASRGGLRKEFIFAPRLDDRLCSFGAIYGLINFSKKFNKSTIKDYNGLQLVILADNEEIGSKTRTGVQGQFLSATIEKILGARNYSLDLKSVLFANSLLISADVTHALNPNFKNEYLAGHYPLPNTGITVKLDENGSVMSDYIGYNILKTITKNNNLNIQQFHIRNDARGGTTIGPYLAIETGARVVDIGLPILSMHSIRAMTGYKDVGIGVQFFHGFFNDWRAEYDKYRGL